MAIARSTPAQKPRGFASRISISVAPFHLVFLADGGLVMPLPETVDDKRSGAARDRAVGDVEGRVTPAAPVEEQEVDDVAEHQAIVQIAKRAADDERKSHAIQLAAAALQEP